MEKNGAVAPPRMPRATFVIRADPRRYFWGRAEGRGLMPVTQITEISLTWDHKSSFFHSKVVSVWGLCPWTPLGDFCPPHPLDLLPRKDLLATPLGLAGMRSAWHNPAWVATVHYS